MRTLLFVLTFFAIACGNESPADSEMTTEPTESAAETTTESAAMDTGDAVMQDSFINKTIRGMYVYFADVGMFEDCSFEKRYPVAMESASIELERAYLGLNLEQPNKVLVTVEGRMEERPDEDGGRARTFLIVDRLVKMEPDKKCGEF